MLNKQKISGVNVIAQTLVREKNLNLLECNEVKYLSYLSLTKPGIIFGNIVTATGGFFLASQGTLDYGLLLATLLGMVLIIASGCVLNNYIDCDIDKLMERTKKRVSARDLISGKIIITYAGLLGGIGLLVLYFNTNILTVVIAFVGWFVYVAVYSLWLKRTSVYGTVIGGISGSVPPVVGFCSVTNDFNIGAVLLFLILFFWQMPHFYSIAIYRIKDYAAASIPVLPVKKGIFYTKLSMLIYIVAFSITAILPSLYGYAGTGYLVVAIVIGFFWLCLAIGGFRTSNNVLWARKMFVVSIINIVILCIMMSIN